MVQYRCSGFCADISADLLEDRRRALALLDRGYSLHEVGRRIGCGTNSVMRWRDASRRGGDEASRVRFSPGRPWKLKQAERKRLVPPASRTAPEYMSVMQQPVEHSGTPGAVVEHLAPVIYRSI